MPFRELTMSGPEEAAVTERAIEAALAGWVACPKDVAKYAATFLPQKLTVSTRVLMSVMTC